ncbi:MAG: hypothetical protein ACOC9B_01780 [Chloroflexota bacterium]
MKTWKGIPLAILMAATLVAGGCVPPVDGSEPGEIILEPEDALDAVVDWLQDEYPDRAPGSGISWTAEDVDLTGPNGEPIVGASAKRFVSDEWTARLDWPVVAPEHLEYHVTLKSPVLGWYWQGSVEGIGGAVTEETPLQQMTEQMAREHAEEFVKDSPTYRFDGMEDTFQYVETRDASGDYAWTFVFSFDSSSAGYGDRSDQMVAEVITPHTAVVTVDAMEITSAILDNKWDMLTQELVVTEEEARQIAEEFVRNSPTFVFDGIENTLELVDTAGMATGTVSPEIDEVSPVEGWAFTFSFESRHAGYGDRTGQMLAQVITPHLAVITVQEGEVTSAVMDGRWDMIQQEMSINEEGAQEIAENFVRNSPTFAFDGMPETLELMETLYPDIENAWGFVFQFESRHAGYGDRTGENLPQVITFHEAHITVQDGEVISALMDEKWDMLAQESIVTEEEARQIAEEFVRNSPTFLFDGMPETLELVEMLHPDTAIENASGFVFRFESRHAGYGDRTGENLAQVITPHEAHITVENGEVISALMDEKWDMLAQEMV